MIEHFCLIFLLKLVSASPNFVFFIIDDQDLHLRSLEFMNKTIKLLANEGTTFGNFYVNSPICCPSRSAILTGKYPHNLRVYNNSINGGCASDFWQKNAETATIASFLKNENYTTFYAGKYLNEYGKKQTGGMAHIPKGYDWWLGLQGNSVYYNYTLSINGTGYFFQKDYLPDLITKHALDFLNQKFLIQEKFCMFLAPPSIHAPFTPAPRHNHLFKNLQTVRTLPFNVTPVDKHWIVQMPPTSLPTNVDILNEIYRNRARTLQAVDDMVEAVITQLKKMGVLDNTFIFFLSDNGFHIGQFTQPWDKRQPYETDVNVPFIVRGPNVSKKIVNEFPVSTVDILPTVLDLVDRWVPDLDGQSFKNQLFKTVDNFSKHILIEYWGEADNGRIDKDCPWTFDLQLSECRSSAWCKCQDAKNNTYSCVLTISNQSKFKFCQFETGFIEAYNLTKDPYEMFNKKVDTDKELKLLEKLRKCKAAQCYN